MQVRVSSVMVMGLRVICSSCMVSALGQLRLSLMVTLYCPGVFTLSVLVLAPVFQVYSFLLGPALSKCTKAPQKAVSAPR